MFKVHLDDTEELALETARKYVQGPGNIFLEGSQGIANATVQNLPGLTDRTNLLPTAQDRFLAASRGRQPAVRHSAQTRPRGRSPRASSSSSRATRL